MIFLKFYLSLGAVHDGTNATAKCPAKANYIMTASFGISQNSSNLMLFSNCSLNSFKTVLLSPDMT
jgi:hypothetical protein